MLFYIKIVYIKSQDFSFLFVAYGQYCEIFMLYNKFIFDFVLQKLWSVYLDMGATVVNILLLRMPVFQNVVVVSYHEK